MGPTPADSNPGTSRSPTHQSSRSQADPLTYGRRTTVSPSVASLFNLDRAAEVQTELRGKHNIVRWQNEMLQTEPELLVSDSKSTT